MTDEKKPAEQMAVTDDKAAFAHRITRRRFTKAGAVAPIVMTLGSRSVWGQTCSPSALDSFSHNSHAPCQEPPNRVSAPASDWLNAALRQGWPSSKDFPGFDALPSDLGSTHFPERNVPKAAKEDVRTLLGQNLRTWLRGVTQVNSTLSALAQQAAAARLNALFAKALATKIGTTQDLFPMRQEEVVDAFWNAIQGDYSKSHGSAGRSSKATSDASGGGANMSVLAAQLKDLNESGTSFL